METKKILIKVTERQTNDGKKKFNTYKAVTKNGRLIDCKFTKNVTNTPDKDCVAIIAVDDMNIDKNLQFPVLWVKAVQGYEDLETRAKENNAKVVNEIFD